MIRTHVPAGLQRGLLRAAALGAAGLMTLTACAPAAAPSSQPAAPAQPAAGAAAPPAQQRTVKVGTFRQTHLMAPWFYDKFLPSNIKLEIVPFDSSTEIKNGVVTGSLDFGVFGLTAALQGGAADEPVRVLAASTDKGSAIVARTDKNVKNVQDLKGKKIGYFPASAQDILLRLTLKDAGLDSAKDVELIKVAFAEMPNALNRGDIDAFAGAEPGPSIAILGGKASVVTFPYTTAMGTINCIFGTSASMVEKNPELVKTMVEIHAKATDYMKAHGDEWSAAAVKNFGQPKDSVDLAIKNVALTWQIDDAYIKRAGVLGEQLVALKQASKQPDYQVFFNTAFVKPLMTKGG